MDADRRRAAEAKRRSRSLARRFELLAGGLVGLLALFVSAYTVYIQRQQLKVQALPRLAIQVDAQMGSSPDEVHATWSLRNTGVAPAEVRSMRMTVDGHDVTDWADFLARVEEHEGIKDVRGNWKTQSPVGAVIGAGQDLPLFHTDSATMAAILAEAPAAHWGKSICYCSMLGDCWLLDSPPDVDESTVPVSECPTYPTQFRDVPADYDRQWADSVLKRAGRDAGADGASADAPTSNDAGASLSPDSVVADYCAAWSTADRTARDRLLARVWTPDGVYSDPDPTLAAGRAALSDTIGAFLSSHTGARFVCSSPQVHHRFMRMSWILLRADGSESGRGMDFGELAPDGRIARITGFFGPPPSVAP